MLIPIAYFVSLLPHGPQADLSVIKSLERLEPSQRRSELKRMGPSVLGTIVQNSQSLPKGIIVDSYWLAKEFGADSVSPILKGLPRKYDADYAYFASLLLEQVGEAAVPVLATEPMDTANRGYAMVRAIGTLASGRPEKDEVRRLGSSLLMRALLSPSKTVQDDAVARCFLLTRSDHLALSKICTSGKPHQRVAAFRVAYHVKSDRYQRAAIGALGASSPEVRTAAINCLVRWKTRSACLFLRYACQGDATLTTQVKMAIQALGCQE